MGGRGASSSRGGGSRSSGGSSAAVVKNNNLNVTDGYRGAFRTAFDNLDKGRLFVPITELRQELNQWSREKFDETLRTLRKERKIQLHQADRSRMTDREWADTYVDENGFHMRRVTWVGK